MEGWAQQLEAILEKEEAILSRISEEARLKTDALKTGDIAVIDEIVNREQPLVLRLKAAEQARLRLLEKAGLSGLTLGELTRRAGAEDGERLGRRLGSMSKLSGGLKRVNTLNAELTRARLEFYSFLRGNGGFVYENNGRAAEYPKARGLIDTNA
jgi:flagellar biosynthesis/type III secretory pathway chaperone